MELGETPEQAALRELKEETNLTGHIRMLLGVTSNHSDKYNTVLIIGYLIDNYTGAPRAGDDASDIACFDFGGLTHFGLSLVDQIAEHSRDGLEKQIK